MRRFVSLLLLAGVTACGDGTLAVDNTNDPSTSSDPETVVSSLYANIHSGHYGSGDALYPQMLVMSGESFSALSNFGMGVRSPIPRSGILNSLNNSVAPGNVRDFQFLSRVTGVAASSIRRLNDGETLGNATKDSRARMFGFFASGVAHGELAMAYDSAGIMTPATAAGTTPPLAGYPDVAAAGLALLDSAIAIAQGLAASADGFPLPSAWIRGNPLSQPQFIGLARSYKAKIRAGIARNPTERAAVNWALVIADAEAGYTRVAPQADFTLDLDPNNGWGSSWVLQHYLFDTWHQMTPFYIGMADSSGQYDAWLATPLATRARFLIQTADRRFPSGSTRALQITASSTAPGTDGRPYFRNRDAGLDRTSLSFGNSMYDFYGLIAFYNAGRIGRYPVITRAEMNLLAAEGYYRTGQYAIAAGLVDSSRVARGGLPSLVTAGVVDAVTPVPGGVGCVPRVPQGPAFTATACGNLFEALKWEKRMETAFRSWAAWYFDGRAWGDLITGTVVQWPTPYQELDARVKPKYNFSSPGANAALVGTYGF